MMIDGINIITVSSFSFPANGHDNDLLSLFLHSHSQLIDIMMIGGINIITVSSFSFPYYSHNDDL